MNIGIGNNRWVKFTRDANGEWRGRGHGYRFRVTRSRGLAGSPQWACTVWRDRGAVVANYKSHKMKSAIQEGARLADVATTELELSCPT